jgi:hypothetical protein
MNRFQPGEHLQVWRGLYHHHGIYVSDERVIQFGSGITLMDKSHTGIDAVALRDFENGGTAEVVRHGQLRLITAYDPPADESWKIIERAEFLLKLQPRLPYHLIGHNCEHIANMCVAGGWTESYQVRRIFGIRALLAFGFLIWLGQRRASLPVPRWVSWAAGTWVISGVVAIGSYNRQIKKFWHEIRDDWFANERKLADDPHNGLTE